MMIVPKDVRRLASNIYDDCKARGITTTNCERSLAEYVEGKGGNVPPYLAIIEALSITYREKMEEYLYDRPAKND
jgi:hypothetical protein